MGVNRFSQENIVSKLVIFSIFCE